MADHSTGLHDRAGLRNELYFLSSTEIIEVRTTRNEIIDQADPGIRTSQLLSYALNLELCSYNRSHKSFEIFLVIVQALFELSQLWSLIFFVQMQKMYFFFLPLTNNTSLRLSFTAPFLLATKTSEGICEIAFSSQKFLPSSLIICALLSLLMMLPLAIFSINVAISFGVVCPQP